MKPVSIMASGMVTSVGLTAPSTCAAIRCGINNFQETKFMDQTGEWIAGGEVPLEHPWRGRTKLLKMAVSAIDECLEKLRAADKDPSFFTKIPLLICVAEKNRPGRFYQLEKHLIEDIQEHLKIQFHKTSAIIASGRVGGAIAIDRAIKLLHSGTVPFCMICGTDTYLTGETIDTFEQKDRILTEQNSDGFIPGEAAGAVLLAPGHTIQSATQIIGVGFGQENAFLDSEKPLRAQGLVQAIQDASNQSGLTINDLDFRITDANGMQYGFKEATLAMTRTLRKRKKEFDIWHPAECIGEVGAAALPIILGVADAATKKNYAPGKNVLVHCGNYDEGQRSALFITKKDA